MGKFCHESGVHSPDDDDAVDEAPGVGVDVETPRAVVVAF
jgi:hypothetical protein